MMTITLPLIPTGREINISRRHNSFIATYYALCFAHIMRTLSNSSSFAIYWQVPFPATRYLLFGSSPLCNNFNFKLTVARPL